MAKRKRRPVQAGEYVDPDEKLETIGERRTYSDELEESLCEQTVRVMKTTPFKSVKPETPVEKVMQVMVNLNVACVLVIKDERLLGVFSERDILSRIAFDFEKTRQRPVREFMTRDPMIIYDADPPGQAINQMAVGGFRHLPILDVDHKVVGIIGPRRVIDYLRKFISTGGEEAELTHDSEDSDH